MYIYSGSDTRLWDAYTILNEPVAGHDLMARAAAKWAERFMKLFSPEHPVVSVCGKGNNGGDGLVVALLLHQAGYRVQVFIADAGHFSADTAYHLHKLEKAAVPIRYLEETGHLPELDSGSVIIDAIFGTGLNRPVSGFFETIIHWINRQSCIVVSLDMPSGLLADEPTRGHAIVKANYTWTFQCVKPCMIMPEGEKWLGRWEVLDIGLHPHFVTAHPPMGVMLDQSVVGSAVHRYASFSHKGTRGHLLLGAGSVSMMGAAVMSAAAAVRSGTGLVTLATDGSGWPVIQERVPEAICAAKPALNNLSFQEKRRMKAIAVGPGWVDDDEHAQLLAWLLDQGILPLVVDATALHLLSRMKQQLSAAAQRADVVITPHVGEFDQLFGQSSNHFERLQLALKTAVQHHIYIVLKGAYTRVLTPQGKCFVNTTGNHGMAKGGSGDVLAGLLGGLMAQGYPTLHAALMAVWLHGYAGDLAAEKYSTEGMTAMDIVACIPEAWKKCL